jgi:hypothetical protein
MQGRRARNAATRRRPPSKLNPGHAGPSRAGSCVRAGQRAVFRQCLGVFSWLPMRVRPTYRERCIFAHIRHPLAMGDSY